MKFWLLLISALIIPFITSAKVLKAKAYLFKAMPSLPAPGMEIIGTIDFWIDGNNKVSINGTISGLAPGQHGFHVHQYGDMNNQCLAAGSHFNPHNQEHGSPNSSVRHVGDLGNIQAGSNGVASVNVEDSQVALNGENSVIGRGLVVHEKVDDLGMGSNADSKKTGNAGARLACGVIGLTDENEEPSSSSVNLYSLVPFNLVFMLSIYHFIK